MSPSPHRELEPLRDHARFVRALAARLVGDDRADDLAQDSAVAAWRHRGTAPAETVRDARAWLAGVARRLAARDHRDRARRSARERRAARPEATPSTADTIANAEVLRQVTDAVLALPEPYRATILARFFEELPPRAIAARDGVAVATVKSRLRRALAELRVRLDDTHRGDRSGWAAPLASLLGHHAPSVATATVAAAVGAAARSLPGVLTMPWKSLVAAALAAVLLLAGFAVWPAAEPGAPSRAVRVDADTASAATPTGGATTDRGRIAVLARGDATATTGTVEFRLSWSDGSPAVDQPCTAIAWGGAFAHHDVRDARTDASGMAHFDALAPGRVTVCGPWGDGAGGVLRAGDTLVLEHRTPPGFALDGRVVDADGAPIAAAEVVVARLQRTLVAARSGVDGSFRLRDLTDQVTVTMRAPGFEPSAERRLEGSVGETVAARFQLQRGGATVEVSVADVAGQPLPGALLWITQLPSDPAEPRRPTWTATTHADGRVRLAGLACGRLRIEATERDHASERVEVEVVPGGTVQQHIVLAPGVTVVGHARDADGTPLAGVAIRSGGGLGERAATSDDTGAYRLTGLPAGDFAVAAGGRDVGTARGTIAGARAGETFEWNPVLDPGRVLQVRLVDARGTPLVGWRIDARGAEDEQGRAFWRQATSGDDGIARIVQGPDAPLSVEVREPRGAMQPFPNLVVADVRAGGSDPVEIAVPDARRATARIVGTAVHADGTPAAARVHVSADEWPGAVLLPIATEVATGAFELAGLPAGTYRLQAHAHPDLRSERIEVVVTPGGDVTAAPLVVDRPGRVLPDLVLPPGTVAADVRASLGPPGPRPVATWSMTADAWPADGLEVPRGRWKLIVTGATVLPSESEFTVEPGRTAAPRLALEPGRYVGVFLWGDPAPARVTMTFHDPSGAHLATAPDLRVDGWPRRMGAVVPIAASYRVDIVADDGRRASTWVEPDQHVEVTLR